jgi:hypothetical protein
MGSLGITWKGDAIKAGSLVLGAVKSSLYNVIFSKRLKNYEQVK